MGKAAKKLMCECEHEAHFDYDTGLRELTPDGNPGHEYGQTFYLCHMATDVSEWGSQNVCVDCKNDCCQPGAY